MGSGLGEEGVTWMIVIITIMIMIVMLMVTLIVGIFMLGGIDFRRSLGT